MLKGIRSVRWIDFVIYAEILDSTIGLLGPEIKKQKNELCLTQNYSLMSQNSLSINEEVLTAIRDLNLC